MKLSLYSHKKQNNHKDILRLIIKRMQKLINIIWMTVELVMLQILKIQINNNNYLYSPPNNKHNSLKFTCNHKETHVKINIFI